MGGSFGGCSWWLLSIIELLFWIALVLLIIWLYKKIAGQKTDAGSALEILKKRLAKGEITKKEFEERKKDFR
ncbi:SHOCT domain-containing protein [Candidatus Woesearchaeota archaeon]|nr:SHOCT domain-containing protein [Candidatus Woesearchaeota archaeon]